MLQVFTSTNVIVIIIGLVLAVALGGFLCYSKIDYKKSPAKKTSSKKKSTKKK